MGPKEFLTDAEEQVIVNLILSAQGRTLPVTKDTIMSLISSLLSDERNYLEINPDGPFKCGTSRPSMPEESWYQLFLKRHPTIDVRMREYLSSSRRNVNQQDVKQWFAHICSYLAENDLLEILYEAKRNFNINEAIFEFSPKESNLLAEKSSKIDNELDRLTVLVNIGANGSLLPPPIIYPKITAIGKMDSGQINNEILYKYLCSSFDEWLTNNNIQRPVIVWAHKHESRMQYHLVKRLTELQIIIILIPPNTSHFMQPLDVGMLTQMKKAWAKRVNDFRALNPNECISKENFARIFLPIYASVISQDKIKDAFRKCGIHPFNVKAPDYSKLTLKATHSNYTTFLGEIEHNGMLERGTQISEITSLQTWFPQSSESKVNSLNEVAMTARGAPREIISKGCDDAVCYRPRNEELLFNNKEKSILQLILEQDLNLNESRTEANIDLTKESKPTSCMMKIRKQSMQEPVSLNWEGNPSSDSIKTQDRTNLTIESDQGDELGLGEEELLNPPTKMDGSDLRDQVKEIVYMELLNPLPEIDADVEQLLGPSLHKYSAERREADLNPPPDLVWNDSRFNNKEWEFGEKHSYPQISCESNLKRVLIQIEKDTEIMGESSHLNCNENLPLSREQNLKRALKFKEDILSCSTRKGSENQCLINDPSPGSKRIRFTLESSDSVYADSETQSAYPIWEENIDSVDKGNSAYFNKCDRTFSTKNGSNLHILSIHNKSNKHKCSICDFAFDLKATLSIHVKTVHDKINLFKCFECNHSFRLKSILTRHINTVHKKLKQFKCTYCNFTSSKMGNLDRHTKSVHMKIKPFKCWICNHLSSAKSDLLKHVKAVHYKLKSFKCNDTFNKNISLNEHILVSHKQLKPVNLNCWEEDPSSHSIKPQKNLTIESDHEEEVGQGLGEEELLNPPFKMCVDDLRDQREEIVDTELLDPLPQMDVDAELLCTSLQDNSAKRAKPELHPPPDLGWEDSLLVKEEWEDEKYSYSPRSSELNRESVLVSDSTTKDELRRTSKEKLYPFLKECFVSIERLPKKFTATDVLKYVDTEKVSERMTNNEKLYPFLKECFVSVERLSKKFTAKEAPKYIAAEMGFHFPEEIKEQIGILSKSTRKGSDIQRSINDTSPSSKRIRLTLEPTNNVDVESESKSAYSICEENTDSVDKAKSPYCNKCDRTFDTINGLNRHILVIHEKIEPIKCCSCDFVVSEKETLSEHIISVHKNLNQHKCPICKLTFDLKGTLSIHLKIDHNVLPFKCTYCDFEAGYNNRLISHVKSVHEKLKPFKCLECNRSFSIKSNLAIHVKSVHEKLKPYKYLKCNYSCNQKGNLESHVKLVHEKIKIFKCLECNRSFSQKGHLAVHIVSVHDKIKPFKCLECNYSCFSKYTLNNHTKSVHLKLKPFKCLKCIYSSSLKFNLESHVKSVHEKIKPFKCLECSPNRSFSQKRNLAIHMKSVHEKLKPYKCLKCNYSCNQKGNLESHVKFVHEKIKRFKCLECNRSFSLKSHLAVHIASVHDKIKPFKCLECNYSCFSKYTLTNHTQSVHLKIKPFKCLECNYSCSQKSGLSRHVNSAHKKIKSFKCLECNRLYSQKSYLALHTKAVHDKIKAFKCLECNRFYSQKSYLALHTKAVHDKIKPFKCLDCNYSFSHKHTLTNHTKSVHLKIKSIKCLECNYSCSFKGTLTYHMKSVHLKLKPFKCLECNYSCIKKSALLRHVNSAHKRIKSYKCLECNNLFSQKGYLAVHIKSVHDKIKPFKCFDCNHSFSQKNNLKRHMSVHIKIKPFKCFKCGPDHSFSKKKDLLSHYKSIHFQLKAYKTSTSVRRLL